MSDATQNAAQEAIANPVGQPTNDFLALDRGEILVAILLDTTSIYRDERPEGSLRATITRAMNASSYRVVLQEARGPNEWLPYANGEGEGFIDIAPVEAPDVPTLLAFYRYIADCDRKYHQEAAEEPTEAQA